MQFCERIGYSCLATILLSSAKMSLIGTVHWPACCNSGCQIWLPGCSASGLGAGAQVPAELACCWQLGFFSGSKWKRALEAYAKLKGQRSQLTSPIANTTND
uniref:Secreted protein n=1 Tax=Macrostomum lignano TaxID=282301 RepID=A0A1I8FL14_9PLAT